MTRLRVLVVDDQADAADLICDLLGGHHDCRSANSAEDALDIAAVFEPHLVLLDIGLPDMSGYEVARQLRSMYGNQVYIAAVTGWAQEKDRVLSVEAGFDHHETKPANRAALHAIVEAAAARVAATCPER